MNARKAYTIGLIGGMWMAVLAGCASQANEQRDSSSGNEDSSRPDASVNRAPVLDPIGNKEVGEGETLAFKVTATDPDGDILVFSAEGMPQGATLDPDSGDFLWIPGDGVVGSVRVAFTVSDGELTDSRSIEIEVLFVPRTVLTEAGTGGLQSGSRGDGGNITLRNEVGGTIEVLLEGGADTSFTVPVRTADLGAVPLRVTEDTTLRVYEASDSEPPVGTAYLIKDRSWIHLSEGDGVIDNNVVTGLDVIAGATLTLVENFIGRQEASVQLAHDLVNRGTIIVEPAIGGSVGDQAPGLYLMLKRYLGTGEVDLRGIQPGDSGGPVWITADFIHNGGVILTGGADNDAGNGGTGGRIGLSAKDLLYNEGELNARGGHCTQPTPPRDGGQGGEGGEIFIEAAAVANSGALITRGGDGTASAGAGNSVELRAVQGDLVNRGAIDASTGDQTEAGACCATPRSGGKIALQAYGETGRVALLASGHMASRGGDAANPDQNGNAGGSVSVASDGDITLSARIDLRGGSIDESGSANPGTGGTVTIAVVPADVGTETRNLRLLGYALLSSRGSAGTPGGHGGRILLDARGQTAVTSEATLDSRGGDAFEDQTGYGGGDGGEIIFEVFNSLSSLTIDGDLLSGGGAGPVAGGFGGDIELICADVSVDALLDTSGGNADPAVIGSTGGDGGNICLPGDALLGEASSFERSGGEGATVGADGSQGSCS